MALRGTILDGYIFRQTLGTMGAVIGIVLSLMVLEHLPRLIEISRLSGHRGYIVAQTVVGLVPEYAGIGLLVGLYLATALTVRRLSMRGELDAIEACGLSPWRWMRTIYLLAAAVCVLTFINQGWLMPAGERRLENIGDRMAAGDFGFKLAAGEFVELGKGNVLNFERIDRESNELIGIFLKTRDHTFTAARGRLAMSPGKATIVELVDGQAIDAHGGKTTNFHTLRYVAEESKVLEDDAKSTDPARLVNLDQLLASNEARDHSVAWGRALWAVLAIFVPTIAAVLGKPPRREAGASGIILGMALVVLFLKVLTPLADGHVARPAMMSIAIVCGWTITAFVLVQAEKTLGQGFIDGWLSRIVARARKASSARSAIRSAADHSAPAHVR